MLKVYSPHDLHLIREIPFSKPKEIERSLERAEKLFKDKKNHIPAWKRIEVLEKVVEIMESKRTLLAKLAAEEGGKPLVDSIVEVDRAINGVKIAISYSGVISGEQIPMGQTKSSQNRLAFTIREPIGVVVSISAFNHPLNLIIHQTVTAIAAGCPVIIKPALTTPLSCIEFMHILKEAGLEDGWCQYIICDNENAEKLATDPRVSFLNFIGSAKVGWYLRSKLSPGTRIALEHGGVAPVIVEADADLNELIPAITKGGFYHAGQVCVSVQRVFVHKDIAKEVAEKLSSAAKKLVVGDPLSMDTEVGPLITTSVVDRVQSWVDEAIGEGAKLLTGGKKLSDSYYEPTVLVNPSNNSKVSKEEVFGPIICIYEYDDVDKAIRIANSLSVSFQASVFAKNIDNALKAASEINASAVMINDHTAFRVDWMPFGGSESSGIGVGGIPYAMKEMTKEKLIVIKSSKI